MVCDANKLYNSLLAEQDAGRHKERAQDPRHNVDPLKVVAIIDLELEPKHEPGSQCPEKKGERNLQILENSSIFSRARRNDTAKEHLREYSVSCQVAQNRVVYVKE